jgi:hypothetical protein
MWAVGDIAFAIVDDMTDDPVVTISVATPAGLLQFAAEPVVVEGVLVLQRTHGQGLTANSVGAGNLMVIAQALMGGMEFDGLVVEGALRTTGANPGHRPRVLRFTRRVRAAVGP